MQAKSEKTRQAKNDGQSKKTAILRRRGWADKYSSLGGDNCIVIFVDEFTRFKVVKLVKKTSDTTAALLFLIADNTSPQELPIKYIRTNYGSEFKRELQQRELDRRSITHEHTPPDTPQYVCMYGHHI